MRYRSQAELDILIDNASKTAFPFLNKLSGADDKELMIELSNEFGYSNMICAIIIYSWRETPRYISYINDDKKTD